MSSGSAGHRVTFERTQVFSALVFLFPDLQAPSAAITLYIAKLYSSVILGQCSQIYKALFKYEIYARH